jgi:molecular chaperone DnaJ
MKNYYLILGIEPNATPEQIRTAYRRQVKDLHPDYYGTDSGPFRDLQEAYEVLSDPERRQGYDRLVESATTQRGKVRRGEAKSRVVSPIEPEPLIPMEGHVALGDYSMLETFHTFSPSFDELFDRIQQNFGLARPKVETLQSVTVEILIGPREALQGGHVRLFVPAQTPCPYCHGRGYTGFFECWRCDGSGAILRELPVEIAFPPGIVNAHVVQLPLDRFGISNLYLNVVFRVSRQ